VKRAALHFFCIAVSAWSQTPAERPQDIFERAVADFQRGRIAQSVAGFDRVAALLPDYAPQLWQRGIALYYAGRFKDCRAQFESHRTVNPDDVENAAWHFLCVARAESPAKARAALLPVGPDLRKPMREIYQMFRGSLTPDQVMAAAGDGDDMAAFYAHLYVGLYYEAAGDARRARLHIRAAADERYVDAGYMHVVARVHRDLLGSLASQSPARRLPARGHRW
jgi:lipoprotein NlpI